MRATDLSGLGIYLLGKPRVERDGEAVSNPRGYKAWGLLAYLLRTDRPPSRDELVSLLFSEADDPFAALRWNLSALRRLLGDAGLVGDPLRLSLPRGAFVDVETLICGSWIDALRLPGIERELLEGMSFSSSPAFDIWLLTERRHLGATAEAVLREAALARLGAGDARAAADLAARLVQVNPFDENFQTLLVRSLAAAGDGLAAARQVMRCTELFRRELGAEPSPALAAAAQTVIASPTAAPLGGRAAARAQLEAGEAAIKAGAIDAGLQCLRRAVVDARGAGDRALHAGALVALGSALVHAARGRDEEAAASLHEALAIAAPPELASSAAAASRELGYVEFLRGRYERAQRWLVRAADLAAEDGAERGRIACILGAVLTDTAHYGRAIEELSEALRLSSDAGDGTQVAFTLAMLGRAHLLRDELDAARAAFDESLAGARRENWTRSPRGPRRCEAMSTSPAEQPTPPSSATSTPSRWPASSATPAGKGSPRADSVSPPPPATTSTRHSSGSGRHEPAASGSPTPGSGSRRTRSTRSARWPSSTACRPHRRGSRHWPRWPRARECVSSPRAPTLTAADSATIPRSRRRGCSQPRSTTPPCQPCSGIRFPAVQRALPRLALGAVAS
jgi:DNA-binding SARP family transcriptional activator